MSFASATWLVALLLVPLALGAHLASRARARDYAVRFSAFSSLQLAGGTVPWWRRHAVAMLVLGALAALILALARPQVTQRSPIGGAAVMLVTDHSGSMVAGDVQPSRLGAAQAAARTFITQLPARARVGVVSFSSGVDAVQPPAIDHRQAQGVIDAETASGATDTGDALQLALDLLNQYAPRAPAAVVLLSDGAWNSGPDPVSVARQAARRRIPIYSVALGTATATIPNPDGVGPPVPVPPDPHTLAQIARVSHARTFAAVDRGGLESIYRQLGSQLASAPRRRDLTTWFTLGGLLLLLSGALLSVRTSARLP